MSAPRTQEGLRRLKGSSVQTRDFFKLAASMANPSVTILAANGVSGALIDKEKAIFSPFLDLAYQQRLYSFKSKAIPSGQKPAELTLSTTEQANIVHLHEKIVTHLNAIPSSIFKLHDHREAKKKSLSVDRAYLFSAHRLKNKSWQTTTGVVSNVRYFHAIFESLIEKKPRDILYWLRFDENDFPIEGNVIKTIAM